MIIEGKSGRVLGLHHVGYGAKCAFPYLAYMMAEGLTVAQLGEMTDLFMDAARFGHMGRMASWVL